MASFGLNVIVQADKKFKRRIIERKAELRSAARFTYSPLKNAFRDEIAAQMADLFLIK